MSSTGQAFVKAFARRNHANSPATTGPVPYARTATHAGTATNQGTANSPNAAANPRVIRQPAQTAQHASPGQILTSAATTELWVNSFDDTISRVDVAATSIASPHIEIHQAPRAGHADRHTLAPEQGTTPGPGENSSTFQTAEAATSESPEAKLAARLAKVLKQPENRIDSAVGGANAIPQASLQRTMRSDTTTGNQSENHLAATQPAVPSISPINQQDAAKRTKSPRTLLKPNWEVEVFDVPQTVADLFFEDSLFQDLSDRMYDSSKDGLQTMLMTSSLPGEGRTTVAVGIALAAASSGLRVALVDADFANPTLAEELRLDLDHSWAENVRRGLPMKEIAVHAMEDNLTLIPLLPTDSGRQATAMECAQMIESLKPSFDLIIIDGPTADARDIGLLGNSIDSVVIVHDVNQSSDASADLLAAKLQRAGISGVGIVENFA